MPAVKRTLGFVLAPTFVVGVLTGACFRGAFLAHQPCSSDSDCARFRCINGFCDGPPTTAETTVAATHGTGSVSDSTSTVGESATTEATQDGTSGQCSARFGNAVFGEACFG